MTTNLHAHVSTAASDCDGPMYDTYVTTLNDDERAEHEAAEARGYNDFHEYTFKGRVIASHTSYHPLDCVTLTITPEGFRMQEVTDEGYRSADVRWCEDESCDPNARSHRDVFAEAAGY